MALFLPRWPNAWCSCHVVFPFPCLAWAVYTPIVWWVKLKASLVHCGCPFAKDIALQRQCVQTSLSHSWDFMLLSLRLDRGSRLYYVRDILTFTWIKAWKFYHGLMLNYHEPQFTFYFSSWLTCSSTQIVPWLDRDQTSNDWNNKSAHSTIYQFIHLVMHLFSCLRQDPNANTASNNSSISKPTCSLLRCLFIHCMNTFDWLATTWQCPGLQGKVQRGLIWSAHNPDVNATEHLWGAARAFWNAQHQC